MGKERAPLGRAGPSTSWVEDELRESALGDARLDARLRTLVGRLAASPGATIPMACQDWAATKAAYRLLDNPRADESRILEGHFVATGRRAAKEDGPILVLHDTTEFTYKVNTR